MQHGYQKTQNFTLILNPLKKLLKMHTEKVTSKPIWGRESIFKEAHTLMSLVLMCFTLTPPSFLGKIGRLQPPKKREERLRVWQQD